MLKIGWSEKDITPKKKIGLDGQFYERITGEVESPLAVTAWAVESDGDSMVICSCDLLGVGEKLVDMVAQRLRGSGVDPSKVVMGAIHTHTSYVYDIDNRISDVSSLDVLKRFLPEDKEYVSLAEDPDVMGKDEATVFLADRIAECIAEAWQTRSAGGYAAGFGRAAVGMNRRVCYTDGTAKMWGDTNASDFEALEGGNDSGIEMLFTYSADGKLSGVVANVACPSQVMEHRSVISSDYWGKVRILLREKYGPDLKVLGLCAAAGDLCPRDLIRWVEPESPINDPNISRETVLPRDADPSMFDVKGTWVIARRIVSEIEYAIEEAGAPKTEAILEHQAERLDVPLRCVTTAEKEAAEAILHNFIEKKNGKFSFEDSAKMHVHAGTIARYELQKRVTVVPIDVHFIRFGDVAFATNPFELFLDYGNQIRARSKARQTFLIQLANGDYGYLPTEKAEKGSHYSAYVSSGFAGHEGGNLLVRETLTRINEMFEREGK